MRGLGRELKLSEVVESDANEIVRLLRLGSSGLSELMDRVAPADSEMLQYAAKLTAEPQRLAAADVAKLRLVGFSDRAIHDICAVVAYFAFVNRIADGLGVELEDES